MKTTLGLKNLFILLNRLLPAVLVLQFSGCSPKTVWVPNLAGPSGSSSCNIIDNNFNGISYCLSLSGITLGQAQSYCTSGNNVQMTYSNTACTTQGELGTCQVSLSSIGSQIGTAYNPTSLSDAMAYCAGQGGVWQNAPTTAPSSTPSCSVVDNNSGGFPYCLNLTGISLAQAQSFCTTGNGLQMTYSNSACSTQGELGTCQLNLNIGPQTAIAYSNQTSDSVASTYCENKGGNWQDAATPSPLPGSSGTPPSGVPSPGSSGTLASSSLPAPASSSSPSPASSSSPSPASSSSPSPASSSSPSPASSSLPLPASSSSPVPLSSAKSCQGFYNGSLLYCSDVGAGQSLSAECSPGPRGIFKTNPNGDQNSYIIAYFESETYACPTQGLMGTCILYSSSQPWTVKVYGSLLSQSSVATQCSMYSGIWTNAQ